MQTHYNYSFGPLFILFISINFYANAQIFSDFQSASTLGNDRIERKLFYRHTDIADLSEMDMYYEDDDTRYNHFGFQVSKGITDKTDFRFQLEYMSIKYSDDDESYGTLAFAFGYKFNIVEDYIAFSISANSLLNAALFHSAGLQPAILLSAPIVKNKVELTLAPKYNLNFSEGIGNYPAVNMNVALSNNLDKWAFHIEYGQLFRSRIDERYDQLSIGLSHRIIKN